MKSIAITFLIIIGLISCKHTPVVEPKVPVNCDSVNVSYSRDITAILKNSCYDCHSGLAPVGGLHLEYYNVDSSLASDNHYLLNIVNGNPDYIYMPPPPYAKLTTCELAKIKVWTDAGCPNN